MSDNEVRELSEKLSEIQRGLNKLGNQVSGIQTTVDLLVEGKINTNTSAKPKEADNSISKIAMAAMEIARMAIAALTGYIAGRGGGV